jgi:hypothetical protein
MKTAVWLAFLCITSINLLAQEPPDALRISWNQQAGTARSMSIGGAVGALGGDLSTVYVNPAGIAFYKTGGADAVLTAGFRNSTNTSTYIGRTESEKQGGLSTGTSGIVFGSRYNNKNGKKSSGAFAFTINRSSVFASNILYRGLNTKNSYSNKFLEEIGSTRDANAVAQNYPFGTSLAFNTYWIDTISGGSTGNYQFQTRAPITSGLLQENIINSKGGVTEFALAFAGSTNEKFNWGFTIGMPVLRFERNSSFTEADATTSTSNKFDFATIDEYLETKGEGVNLKTGFIYRPAPAFRLGFALHTPTVYRMTDKYNARVTTNTESYKGLQTQSSNLFTNNNDASFSYVVTTPVKLIASAAYVLHEVQDTRKQKGFISADLEFVNHKGTSYSRDPQSDNSQSTRQYLKSLNQSIDNAYKSTLNIRVGGELKFNQWMVRGGFNFLGNPYVNIAGEKGNKTQLCTGFGYRNKGIFVDLTYINTQGNDVHYAYRLSSQPFYGASIKQSGNMLVFTIGTKI